jgi:uncharacterized protein DUF6335
MAAKKHPKRKAASKSSARGRARTKSSTRRAASARRRKPRRAARRPKRAIKARKAVRKAKPARRPTRPARRKQAAASGRPIKTPAPATLARERRRLSDDERLERATFADDRLISSARAGHDELRTRLNQHTETSPALAGGDIDAKWQDAYAVGDEAPGGDNPTPGQDRVDDIGKALGVNYRRDEELKGGDEIAERDKHRWELDPASSDDWPHGNKD